MAVLRRFGWTAGLTGAYNTAGLNLGTGGFETTSNYRHLTNTGLGSAYGLRAGNTTLTGIPSTALWMCCDAAKIATVQVWGWVFRRSGTDTFSVTINTAGQIELRRGNQSATLLATSTVSIPFGNANWFQIELLAAEAGYCNVYLGASTTPAVTYTGDTRAASSNGWDEIIAYNVSWRWNDIVIDDATRWAEVFSMSRVANSDSVVTGWTPSTGGTSFGVVDEIPWSTTDYTSAVVDMDELRLGHVALPAGVSVAGASVLAYFARDGTINDINLLVVSGGSTSYSGPQAGGASGAYGMFAHFVDLDPATGAAWSVAALDAALIGARIEA